LGSGVPEVNSVILILQGHCIETAARERLSYLIRRSIVEDVSEDVMSEIEFLTDFIKVTDFKMVRSQHPEYNGRMDMVVRVTRACDGTYKIEPLR